MDPTTKLAVAATVLGMAVGAALSKEPTSASAGVGGPVAKSAPVAPLVVRPAGKRF